MTDRELMQQALDVIELPITCGEIKRGKTIAALRERLAHPEWQSLTEEEINNSYLFWVVDQQDVMGFGKSLETKLKRKNT